jgi:ATP-binding protein involved in chromosome partitioning
MHHPLSLVKNVISVSSGKGGVGKSTIAFHLAHTLIDDHSLRVGLLDADIHGPSLPTLMGLMEKPQIVENKIVPLLKDGLKAMSMGFLVDPQSALIWRGLMVQKAIKQLLFDVEWGNLDVLVIDMPPGTGDIPLTINQLVPLSGGIVVSTSDPLSLVDGVKGVAMLKKMGIPFWGFIENMAHLVCPQCETHISLSHDSLVEKEAVRVGDAFLGSIPFDQGLRFGGAMMASSKDAFKDIVRKVIPLLKQG